MIAVGGFNLTQETLVSTIGIALFTAMAVSSFIKPFLAAQGIEKGSLTYPLYINISALLVAEAFSLMGLVIAQLALDSAPTVLFALVRGFAAAFFATGGYEAYSSTVKFIAGRSP